jgi:hypothetical protein
MFHGFEAPRSEHSMKETLVQKHVGVAVAIAAGFVWLTVASAMGVSVTRAPYLQLSSPTNITLCWRTDVATGSRVVYGTAPGALTLTNDQPALETNHFVTLTGLQPDTRYYYAIGTTGTTLAGPGSSYFFLTHPWPGTEKPIRVWVLGDAGTASYGNLFARQQRAVRDAFVNFNGTNTLHAWLQLGDNAYRNGTDREFDQAMFNIYPEQLRSSVTWPALGNHDTASSTEFVDTYPYFSIFHLPKAGEAGGVPSGAEHFYSFDLGMVHFICLDSQTADQSANGAMRTWLRADLAANTNRWTVAYWHHPPYTRGGYDSDARDELVRARENFLPTLEAGGVDLVLSGHSHVYERSFLIDGHYGIAATFDSNTMQLQPGNGRETNGVGAYLKPDSLGKPAIGHKGTVYMVAGCSGQVTATGNLNHPIMAVDFETLGSVVLDFASNRLDAIFLPTNGVPADWFSIIKEQTASPSILSVTPPEALVNEGASVSFAVAAAGSPPLTYQWQLNGSDLNGARDATLALTNVVFAQAGTYTVVVSGPGGSVSSNAVLAVNRAPIADAGATTKWLLAANGSNTVAVLDGSLSSDPDGDELAYLWFMAGATSPLATGMVAVASQSPGTNWLKLVVNDGVTSVHQDFALVVNTPADAVARLMKWVQAEADKPQPLLASLRAALASFNRGQPHVAINQLEAFMHKVQAQVGSADSDLAARLVAEAQSVMDALKGEATGAGAPLAITSFHVGSNRKVHLRIRGSAGRLVLVETSTDLKNWVPVGVAKQSGEDAFEFEYVPSSAGAHYYRVRRP